MKKKKRKIKYKNVVIMFVVIIGIIFIINNFGKAKQENDNKGDIPSFVGKNLEELSLYADKNNYLINSIKEYNNEYAKGVIIESSYIDNKI